ncbi:uncharacterized protein LOC110460933 [Mizuhopecten yessoensis]|uniref:uncharacterized protein LOC110460933 n=1 Tax=Mizuhopecten yessoensis TaxID=6573 RepID=UPI000B45E827|nr:uncharacterized protein LOC110460933 [Mizuhopecten yessoensis]
MFGILLKGLVLVTLAKRYVAQDLEEKNNTKTEIKPCCVEGVMKFDLSSESPKLPLSIDKVEVVYDRTTRARQSRSCNREVILRANFEKTDCGCRVPPECGRKMLRIDMEISYSRGFYLFAMGDSVSNDGWGGDSGNQQNDAEFFGVNDYFFLFKGDKCLTNSSYATLFAGTLTPGVFNYVTVFISNEHIRIINNYGVVDEQVCHQCLYALAGQSDSEGSVNEDLYISFNRMIRVSSGRVGYGVCSATVQWVCPYTFDN